MQAVLDFLLEYFYWILGVLVVLLITVIGFLADTKRKKKLREKNTNGETNNGDGKLNNANMGEMNINSDFNNVNMEMNNNMLNGMNTMSNMGVNDLNTMNNITPDINLGVHNINTMPDVNVNMMNNESVSMPSQQEVSAMPNVNEITTSTTESVPSSNNFFTPASQQTPTFAPRDVTIPTPVEPTPVMNNSTPTMNSWNMQGNANVSPVEVTPVAVASEVQPSVPSFGTVDNGMNVGINPIPNFETVNSNVTPVIPETPVISEVPANMNVMPEVTPQVEPLVNHQVNSEIPNFGPGMNQVQGGQVEPVSAPVTPNFVTGAVPTNNMPNSNINNLNG